MIIVDLETSGVDPEKHSILSLGAVDFDHPEKTLYLECRMREGTVWSEAAARVHGFSQDAVSRRQMSEEQLVRTFIAWIGPVKDKTLAGQCVHFDRGFLQAAFHRYRMTWIFGHMLVDVHSIAYALFVARGLAISLYEDTSAISLDQVLVFLGLPRRQGHHNALQDALLEAECLSRMLRGVAFLDEYRAIPVGDWTIHASKNVSS